MDDGPDELTQENLARHNEIFDQIDKDLEEADEQRRYWSDSKWFNAGMSAENFLRSRDNHVEASGKSPNTCTSTTEAALDLPSERSPGSLSPAAEDFLNANCKQVEVDLRRLRITPQAGTVPNGEKKGGTTNTPGRPSRPEDPEKQPASGSRKGLERLRREQASLRRGKRTKAEGDEILGEAKCVVC